jgi:steroid 5-alpha reductase family enzyme
LRNEPALETGDILAAGVMLSFIGLSAIADQQQWNFQNAKQEYKKTARIPKGYTQEEFERGFLTKGLFAYSRHPNFAAEQSVWVTLHTWSCYSTEVPFNWTGIGVLCYLALFQGSTWLTELLSMQKYPEYRDYKQKVGMFVPSSGAYTPGPKKLVNGTSDKGAAKARERYDLR